MKGFLSNRFIKYSALMLIIFLNSILLISHEALWYDESYSAAVINHSFSDIWHISGSDNHPPLYFLMLKLFCLIFGHREFSLRLFSVIGTLLLAYLAFGPIRQIFDKSVRNAYMFLIFILPVFLSYSQEARMYTWAAYFVTSALLYGYLTLKYGKVSNFVFYFIFALSAAYTHYYALLAVIFIQLTFLFLAFKKESQSIKGLLLSAFFFMALYSPWIFSLWAQIEKVYRDFWILPITPLRVINTFLYPFEEKFLPTHLISAIIAFLIFTALMATGFRKLKPCSNEREIFAVSIIIYTLTIFTGVFLSYVIRPVFIERYVICVIGVILIPAAYGLSRIKRNYLKILVCILLFVILLPQNLDIRLHKLNGPMKEVEDYLSNKISSEDIFIHNDEHTFGTFNYYFPKNRHYLYYKPGSHGYSGFDAFKPKGMVVSELDSFIKGKKRIWLVNRLGTSTASLVNTWLDEGKFKLREGMKTFMIPQSLYGVTLRLVEAGNGTPETQIQRGKIAVNIENPGEISKPLTVRLFNKDGLFAKEQGIFNDENVYMTKTITAIQGSNTQIVFENIPYGNYAVFVHDDKNQNGKIDIYGGILIQERYGTTINLENSIIPCFEVSMFNLNSPYKKVNVKMVRPYSLF